MPGFGSLGGTELIIALVIILLLFGAKRIPELARGLGSGVREFRAGTKEGQLEKEEEKKDEEQIETSQDEDDDARSEDDGARLEDDPAVEAEKAEQKRS
jgi:sec-independent protein translocase protein TatA